MKKPGKILFFVAIAMLLTLPALADSFGAPLTITESTTIAAIMEKPGDYLGKPLLVEGTVVSVCRSRGCWMELSDGDRGPTMKVKVRDGAMVFPMSTIGKTARVQGVVELVGAKMPKEGETCPTDPSLYRIVPTGVVVN